MRRNHASRPQPRAFSSRLSDSHFSPRLIMIGENYPSNEFVCNLLTHSARRDSAVQDFSLDNRSTSWYTKPCRPNRIMGDYIQPAAKAAKITKHIHWHGFRHAYGSLLKANGEDVKVVQDSLRHASSQITMDVYVQAIPAAVRSAHGRVVVQIAAELSCIGPGMDPSSAAASVSD